MQDEVRWAMAGRNKQKLEKIRDDLAREYPAAKSIPILTGDAEDQDSLVAIASQTKVLIATSGPFAKLGTPVVEACISAGTHYCDITGRRVHLKWCKDLSCCSSTPKQPETA
jgi:short subunit dehydrogenase-like uncharacterized protein